MLQNIRERATGWFAYVIIILISIPFALWGINSYFDPSIPTDAAEVNGEPISINDVQRAYQQQQQRLQSMLGGSYNPSMINEAALRQQALQSLVDDAVLRQTAESQNMRVGDEQLSRAIREIDVFQDNGVFDTERYQRLISMQGFSAPQFEESYRSDLVADQLRSGLVNSALLTEAELERLIALLHQKRELAFIQLSLDNAKSTIELDDAAVTAYYDENKNRFTSPEQMKVQYIELKLDDIASAIPISDDELQAEYENRRDQYVREEERSASHILITLDEDADEAAVAEAQARAQAIYDSIQADEKTFEQALEEAQQEDAIEGGELGVIFKGMLEPGFEDALYALAEQGDVSEPVRTSSGFHIVKLDAITPEQVQSFDDVKDELEQDLQRLRAENEFFDLTERLATLSFENGGSLQPAADELGLEIKESKWFTRSGAVENDATETAVDSDDTSITQYPQVLQTAFGNEVLNDGLNSESLEVEPSHVIVLRKLDYKEPAPLSLDEARERIVEQLKDERARELLQQRVDELKQQAEQGESLETLAESLAEGEGELKTPGLVERTNADTDPAVLNQAFQLAMPANQDQHRVGDAELGNGDQALFVVSKVEPGSKDDLSEEEREAMQERISGQIGSTEFDAFLQSSRQQAEIVTFPDRL